MRRLRLQGLPTLPLLAALLGAGCVVPGPPPLPRSFPSARDVPAPEVVSSRTLTESGGSLDWCAKSDRIAFARSRSRRSSEIYTIRPDGSDERCITCGNEDLARGWKRGLGGDVGRGMRGAPAWHPSCEFLVIQVGAPQARPSQFEQPPFGVNNDLWLVAADGSWAERIVTVPPLSGSMAPRFSDGGDRLLWTAREPTGQPVRQTIVLRTPGRENPWHGWHLVIADFERPTGGPAKLSLRSEHFRGGPGFIRGTALTGDTVWFSQTANRRGYVDEIFRAVLPGGEPENLSQSPRTWQDQGEPSPWGSLVTFRSSLPLGWSSPPHPIGTVRLELWALTAGGEPVQLTRFNEKPSRQRRMLVLDYAWGPTGREIALYVVTYEIGAQPRHAIEIHRLNHRF